MKISGITYYEVIVPGHKNAFDNPAVSKPLHKLPSGAKAAWSLQFDKLPFAFCREYDGFECAIWDAYARMHQMRVVDLLGGPRKNLIKVGTWSCHRTVEDVGDLVSQYQSLRYDCIKFK